MVEVVKNPRGPDGSLGTIRCENCNSVSGAYVKVLSKIICKSCLLKWIDVINKQILS